MTMMMVIGGPITITTEITAGNALIINPRRPRITRPGRRSIFPVRHAMRRGCRQR